LKNNGDDIQFPLQQLLQQENKAIITHNYTADRLLVVNYVGQIDNNFVAVLMGYLSNCEYEEFALMISSGGGDASLINTLPVTLKQMGLRKIIGYGQSSSAALAILMLCKNMGIDTYIDPLCQSVLHRCSSAMLEQRSERMKKYIKHFVEDFEVRFDKINAELLSKLGQEDLRDYQDGNDVYLLGFDLIDWKILDEYNANSLKIKNKPIPKNKKVSSKKKKDMEAIIKQELKRNGIDVRKINVKQIGVKKHGETKR
jgi:hypothetical protein